MRGGALPHIPPGGGSTAEGAHALRMEQGHDERPGARTASYFCQCFLGGGLWQWEAGSVSGPGCSPALPLCALPGVVLAGCSSLTTQGFPPACKVRKGAPCGLSSREGQSCLFTDLKAFCVSFSVSCLFPPLGWLFLSAFVFPIFR